CEVIELPAGQSLVKRQIPVLIVKFGLDDGAADQRREKRIGVDADVLIPLIHLAAVGLAWRMLVKERRPLRAWHRAQPKHHHAVVHLLPQRLDTLSDRPRPSTAGERVAALTLGLGQFTLGLLDL